MDITVKKLKQKFRPQVRDQLERVHIQTEEKRSDLNGTKGTRPNSFHNPRSQQQEFLSSSSFQQLVAKASSILNQTPRATVPSSTPFKK